jgi:hypothetical protein
MVLLPAFVLWHSFVIPLLTLELLICRARPHTR